MDSLTIDCGVDGPKVQIKKQKCLGLSRVMLESVREALQRWDALDLPKYSLGDRVRPSGQGVFPLNAPGYAGPVDWLRRLRMSGAGWTNTPPGESRDPAVRNEGLAIKRQVEVAAQQYKSEMESWHNGGCVGNSWRRHYEYRARPERSNAPAYPRISPQLSSHLLGDNGRVGGGITYQVSMTSDLAFHVPIYSSAIGSCATCGFTNNNARQQSQYIYHVLRR